MNILKNNGRYIFYNALQISKELEPKNYVLNYDGYGVCFLEDAEDFIIPDKIYDVDEDLRGYIKTSFINSNRNLGVLLTGNKGQGKSLTAKMLCKELNLPVILINKSIEIGVNFINFLNDIKQNYVLFVDEFEKLFVNPSSRNDDKTFHDQEAFLTFMDGVLTNKNKILFLLTTNDSVNEFFINRPSRIKFLQEYDELPEELFEMIVDDKLVDKAFKQDLEENISLVNLNIDLLISIINDINLFNKPFSTFKDHYNYKFEKYRFELSIIREGREEYERVITQDRKIKANQSHIGGYHVEEMIKFTKEEILFKASITNWDKDDNSITEPVKIKLVPTKLGSYKEYAF